MFNNFAILIRQGSPWISLFDFANSNFSVSIVQPCIAHKCARLPLVKLQDSISPVAARQD